MRHNESRLQQSCVRWFDYQYNDIHELLFAIPNGGARSKIEAGILKGEGVRAGVADMILLVPKQGYSSLCIEFKTDKGKQTETQKNWQNKAEKHKAKYVVVRTFEEFQKTVEYYLSPKFAVTGTTLTLRLEDVSRDCTVEEIVNMCKKAGIKTPCCSYAQLGN